MGRESLRTAHSAKTRWGWRMRRPAALTVSLLLAIGGNLYLAAPPAVAAPRCALNPMGAATPLGADSGFTLFTTGDAIMANSELEGSLAVGGTASFGATGGDGADRYVIFHSNAGNKNYGLPETDGGSTRVLLNKYAPGNVNKIVQVKADGLVSGPPGLVKLVNIDSPSGYTFRKDFGSSGTTFWPATGNNQSPQLASFVQPWKGSTDTSADGVAAAKASFQTKGSFGSYFPTDQGQSILAGVTDWKVPTVTGSDDMAVTLDLSGPNRLALADFGSAQKFHFQDGITYSPCAPLVIKVSASDVVGGTLTLPSFAVAGKEAGGIGISYILWDLSGLSGTVSITAPNEPVRGAIYAPNANIVFPSGGREFEGQLIAKQLTALQVGKEIHTNLFAGRFAAAPTLATSVEVSGSSEKVLPLSGGSVVDTVSYTGLAAGTAYKLSGELVTADGTATGIVASAQFVPTTDSGSERVVFTLTKSQVERYAGQPLVAFESLATQVDPGRVLASHRDLADAAQTFSIADPRYAVGDVVWIDADRDGVQDAEEKPLAGVTVRLLSGSDSSVLKTSTTDTNGRYLFDELAAGHYRVQFELTPAQADVYTFTRPTQGSDKSVDSDAEVAGDAKVGTTSVFPLDASNTSLTTSYTSQTIAATAGIDPTWDAGVVVDKVSVGDRVWFDANRDGLQSAGEAPAAGVRVRLWPGTSVGVGTPLATTTTDAQGYYSFTGLSRGTGYSIQFVAPDGASWTTPNAGGRTDNDASADLGDSDVSAAGVVGFTAPSGGSNLGGPDAADNHGIDAGLVAYNLSLSKQVDGAGPYAPGDLVAFTLTPHNDGPADALAGWSVTDLLPSGLELVSIAAVEPGSFTCDQASATCVASAALAAGADGPAVLVTTRIKDLAGTVANVAYIAPAASDAPETNPLTVPGASTDPATSSTDNDASASLNVDLVSIGDHTWWDANRNGQQDAGELPVPGVRVTLLDASGTRLAQTTTDASGDYYFDGLLPNTRYQVLFGRPEVDGVADPSVAFTAANVGADASDSDADPATGLVSVTTPRSGTNHHGIGTADEDQPSIDAGYLSYDLQLAKTLITAGPFTPGQRVSYELVPHNAGPVDAVAGWKVTEVLPTGLSLVSMDGGSAYDCSGLVCTAKEALAGDATGDKITVTATIGADVTGTVTNLAYVQPATADIAEANPLGSELPTAQTDPGRTSTNNDAAASLTVQPVSIGDLVWYDNDRNGARGPVDTEPGAAGVTVRLFRGEAATGLPVSTTLTDNTGHYAFTDLLPGTKYTLQFIQPDGYSWTSTDAGAGAAADLVDSDVSSAGLIGLTTPLTGANAAAAGQADDPSLDAGLIGYNLSLAKRLDTTSTLYLGDTVEFTLTPHNDGPAYALAGWGVTDVLPAQLELVSMAPAVDPADYRCSGATCVAARPLAAGADGPALTVTAKVAANLNGSVKNVAYVFPDASDVAEKVALERPADADVDTRASTTDNDAEAPVQVSSLVSIGDHVWLDVDRDGTQDETAPLSGVTVKLYATDGTSPLATTSTDEHGFYSFTDLRPATDYRVEFVAPAGGYVPTSQHTGAATGDSNPDAAGGGHLTPPASGGNSATAPDDPTIDAGFVAYNLTVVKELVSPGPFYEGNQVTFRITPGNDGPTAALAGWSVSELPQAGLTITGLDGGSAYTCTGTECTSNTALPAGASAAPITVTAVIDEGFVGTLRNLAFVAPAAGDVAESNPLVRPSDASVDAAATPTDNDSAVSLSVDSLVSQGDYVWWDNDRDGLRGPTEPGVPGLTVRLFDADGNLLRSTVTDADGRYFFSDLVPAATYQVEFVKPSAAAFTRTDGGSGDVGRTLGSDADPATGRATFVAAATGRNLTGKGEVDTPAIDAGLVRYNLRLSKQLQGVEGRYPDELATFVLIPHNDGPSDALAGWSITDLLSSDATLASAFGDGYTCAGSTCVNDQPIAAGADGPVLTVVLRASANAQGERRNVAYIAPADGDVVEANALVLPGRDTDTRTTDTDNDAQAVYAVAGVEDPEPGKGGSGPGGGLAFTGADVWPVAGLGLGLLVAGCALLVARRRRA